MKCSCGNTSFYAVKVLHVSAILDGQNKVDNEKIRGASGSIENSIFKSETVGPFICTRCKREFDEFE